jgi:hypothetical protein
VLGIGDGRFERLLDDAGGLLLRELRTLSALIHLLAADQVGDQAPLSADRRTPRTIALVSIMGSLFLGLLVGRVTLEGPRQREFAELVADHLVGHVHGHVLLAVVHGDRQTDEVRAGSSSGATRS